MIRTTPNAYSVIHTRSESGKRTNKTDSIDSSSMQEPRERERYNVKANASERERSRERSEKRSDVRGR